MSLYENSLQLFGEWLSNKNLERTCKSKFFQNLLDNGFSIEMIKKLPPARTRFAYGQVILTSARVFHWSGLPDLRFIKRYFRFGLFVQ